MLVQFFFAKNIMLFLSIFDRILVIMLGIMNEVNCLATSLHYFLCFQCYL